MAKVLETQHLFVGSPQSLTSAYVMASVNSRWQKPISVKYASNSGLGLGGLERQVGLYSKSMIILDFLVESFMSLHGT